MTELDRKQVNDKILIIGIDGMDPDSTQQYLETGDMPNLQKMLARGAANKSLGMIGSHPTGTPPMWTTLATGAQPYTHGITDFNMPSEKGIEFSSYGFDSRKCKAEQLWNVFAEAGMKTLVINWPGSSWPPSSDSPNLNVIDGTQPGGVNAGVASVTEEFYATASLEQEQVEWHPAHEGVENAPAAPCVIDDMDAEEAADGSVEAEIVPEDTTSVVLDNTECVNAFAEFAKYSYSRSPISDPKGWDIEVPEGAREFIVLTSDGQVRRPCLILKNEAGVYETVRIYDNKKKGNLIVELTVAGGMAYSVKDVELQNGAKVETIRSIRLLELAEDGSSLRIFFSGSLKTYDDSLWSPRELFADVVANVGYPQPHCMYEPEPGFGEDLFTCELAVWDEHCNWQSAAIHYLIESQGYQVVFSHCHNVDAMMHVLVQEQKQRDYSQYSEEMAREAKRQLYIQTDRYIGSFLHYIDEGWTLFVISDHGLICAEYEMPNIGNCFGVHAGIMGELGYTVMKKDADGNDTHEIDWTKTTAISRGSNFIYLNMKGLTHTDSDGNVIEGIVDPADKYQLEEQIMTDLYSYKDKNSGMRVIGCAVRNKDGVLFGQSGENAGDIIFYIAEGYNGDHFDGWTVNQGVNHTSLAPVFIAAGPGIKQGVLTDRIIHQTDVAPTVAVIGGVRMPRDCEGAPVYQILEREY